MQSRVLRLALGAAVLCCSFWVGRLSIDASPPGEVPVTNAAALAQIHDDLRTLRDETNAFASRAGLAIADPSASPKRDDVAPNADCFETLRSMIESLHQEVAALYVPPQFQELPVVPKNEAAIVAMLPDLPEGRNITESRIFCWTPQMVYRAFGTPEYADANDGRTIWRYSLANAAEQLDVVFSNGVVTRLVKSKSE